MYCWVMCVLLLYVLCAWCVCVLYMLSPVCMCVVVMYFDSFLRVDRRLTKQLKIHVLFLFLPLSKRPKHVWTCFTLFRPARWPTTVDRVLVPSGDAQRIGSCIGPLFRECRCLDVATIKMLLFWLFQHTLSFFFPL